jgi:hypothetical protein
MTKAQWSQLKTHSCHIVGIRTMAEEWASTEINKRFYNYFPHVSTGIFLVNSFISVYSED